MAINLRRVPLSITSDHPARVVIQEALLRRGDRPEVAGGRAIAITDLLVRDGHLKLTTAQREDYRRYRNLEKEFIEQVGEPTHVDRIPDA